MGLPATITETGYVATAEPTAANGPGEMPSIFRESTGRRSRAERRGKGDVPWLSVRLPWGLEGRLLNISSTGLLLESGAKLTSGSVTQLKLCGPDTELVVAVCFVRSEIGVVDHVGVKYRTAVTFEKPLALLEPPPLSRALSSPAAALSELLTQVSEELDRGSHSSLRAALETGVRQIVNARDIQIRSAPFGPNDGRTSIDFSVPTGIRSPAILQAMFAPGYEPTDLQFKLLRAAAGLAAVILQFEERR